MGQPLNRAFCQQLHPAAPPFGGSLQQPLQNHCAAALCRPEAACNQQHSCLRFTSALPAAGGSHQRSASIWRLPSLPQRSSSLSQIIEQHCIALGQAGAPRLGALVQRSRALRLRVPTRVGVCVRVDSDRLQRMGILAPRICNAQLRTPPAWQRKEPCGAALEGCRRMSCVPCLLNSKTAIATSHLQQQRACPCLLICKLLPRRALTPCCAAARRLAAWRTRLLDRACSRRQWRQRALCFAPRRSHHQHAAGGQGGLGEGG